MLLYQIGLFNGFESSVIFLKNVSKNLHETKKSKEGALAVAKNQPNKPHWVLRK